MRQEQRRCGFWRSVGALRHGANCIVEKYKSTQKVRSFVSAESHGIKITAFPGKKALDKYGVLAYNKDRKSIPVDGLLPLLELRFNRRELVAGAVISFSCRGDSDYYFYDYSKCTRSR